MEQKLEFFKNLGIKEEILEEIYDIGFKDGFIEAGKQVVNKLNNLTEMVNRTIKKHGEN